jgi:hypothetical protein
MKTSSIVFWALIIFALAFLIWKFFGSTDYGPVIAAILGAIALLWRELYEFKGEVKEFMGEVKSKLDIKK